MLRGLTRAGLGNVGSAEQFIALASKYGFQSVDIDVAGLVDGRGVDGAAELLRSHGLVIGSIGLPVQWRTTEEEFRSGLPTLMKNAALAQQLGCTSSTTYILPSTDEPAAPFMAAAIRRLRLCAQIYGAYGIRLGLEFVGPHHLRTRWKNPFIWTMADTLDMIEAIGEPNVGLLLDCYHWYTNGLGTEHITRLRAEQIVHVHLNDAPNVPVHEALDNGRLLTGEGVIDLVGFLKALKQTGYTGSASQEVLTQQPPQEPAEELLARTKEQYDRLFAAAGIE
ncbi:sugar phosphate isomerase/epimerase family protein [Paenibacillus ginsengarvi]|uniref:Sugar phosphate isomerase/epimerase n=1 Tax=Paenibacillus ginsengarvi TaxID=400777 RepID=A0A3B0CH31_9BACL|nr:sugar phosphate isomerase/epimerase family protein [Paenibacillus ginsengarvi]RKN85085.1 sugar phosphate isomerase/epimerase [Paenibacillus ginsengarvi]